MDVLDSSLSVSPQPSSDILQNRNVRRASVRGRKKTARSGKRKVRPSPDDNLQVVFSSQPETEWVTKVPASNKTLTRVSAELGGEKRRSSLIPNIILHPPNTLTSYVFEDETIIPRIPLYLPPERVKKVKEEEGKKEDEEEKARRKKESEEEKEECAATEESFLHLGRDYAIAQSECQIPHEPTEWTPNLLSKPIAQYLREEGSQEAADETKDKVFRPRLTPQDRIIAKQLGHKERVKTFAIPQLEPCTSTMIHGAFPQPKPQPSVMTSRKFCQRPQSAPLPTVKRTMQLKEYFAPMLKCDPKRRMCMNIGEMLLEDGVIPRTRVAKAKRRRRSRGSTVGVASPPRAGSKATESGQEARGEAAKQKTQAQTSSDPQFTSYYLLRSEQVYRKEMEKKQQTGKKGTSKSARFGRTVPKDGKDSNATDDTHPPASKASMESISNCPEDSSLDMQADQEVTLTSDDLHVAKRSLEHSEFPLKKASRSLSSIVSALCLPKPTPVPQPRPKRSKRSVKRRRVSVGRKSLDSMFARGQRFHAAKMKDGLQQSNENIMKTEQARKRKTFRRKRSLPFIKKHASVFRPDWLPQNLQQSLSKSDKKLKKKEIYQVKSGDSTLKSLGLMKFLMQKSAFEPLAANKSTNNIRFQSEGDSFLDLMTRNLRNSPTPMKPLMHVSAAPLPETIRPLNKSTNSITAHEKDSSGWEKPEKMYRNIPARKHTSLGILRAVQEELARSEHTSAQETHSPKRPRKRAKERHSIHLKTKPSTPPLPNCVGRESPTNNNCPVKPLQKAHGIKSKTKSRSPEGRHHESPAPKSSARPPRAGPVQPAWVHSDVGKISQWETDDDDWDIASQMEEGSSACFFHNDDVEPSFPSGTGELSTYMQSSLQRAKSIESPTLDPELERLEKLLNEKARRTLHESWFGFYSYEDSSPTVNKQDSLETASSEATGVKGKKRGAKQKKGGSAPTVTTESVATSCRGHWQQFAAWCLTKGYNPLRSTSEAISEFLAHLVHVEKRSKHCVGRVLHALAAALKTKAGVDISKDLTLQNILSEAWTSESPKTSPEKTLAEGEAIWDLEVVLQALKNPPFEPLEQASFKMLSYKTAMLTALASGRHCVDIHAIDVFTSKHHSCWSWIHCKTVYPHFSRRRADPWSLQSFTLKALPQRYLRSKEHLLCPVRAISIYYDRTRSVRRGRPQLFLPMVPSSAENTVTESMLASWLVRTISAAYKVTPKHRLTSAGNSDLLALTSKLEDKDTVEKVLQGCYWRSDNVFSRFYLKSMAKQTRDVTTLGFLSSGTSVSCPPVEGERSTVTRQLSAPVILPKKTPGPPRRASAVPKTASRERRLNPVSGGLR